MLIKKEASTYKILLALILYVSKLFDFSYSAAQDDEGDILYKNDNEDDMELLLDCLEFSTPSKLAIHQENLYRGMAHLIHVLMKF